MRNIVGNIFVTLGIITYIIFGLWGLIIEVAIINQVVGFWGVVIGFMLFPVMLTVTPWYALVAWGTWFPLLIVYGGGIVATILYASGKAIKGEFE